jgi:hypothetical protein
MLLAGGGMLLIYFPAGPWPFCMYVGVFLVAVGMAFARVNLDTLAQASVAYQLRGTAAALQYAFFDVWNGIFGWGMGVLVVQAGYPTLYIIGAAVACVWAVMLWLLTPRRKAVQSGPSPATLSGSASGAND